MGVIDQGPHCPNKGRLRIHLREQFVHPALSEPQTILFQLKRKTEKYVYLGFSLSQRDGPAPRGVCLKLKAHISFYLFTEN